MYIYGFTISLSGITMMISVLASRRGSMCELKLEEMNQIYIPRYIQKGFLLLKYDVKQLWANRDPHAIYPARFSEQHLLMSLRLWMAAPFTTRKPTIPTFNTLLMCAYQCTYLTGPFHYLPPHLRSNQVWYRKKTYQPNMINYLFCHVPVTCDPP